MALLEGEHHRQLPLTLRLKEQSPPCDKCAHYWPTVAGLMCLWRGEKEDTILPEAIEETETGHCDAFRYR